MDEESLNNLSKSVNDAFFECLESAMGCTILPEIRNILQFNYYNNAITISKIDENALREMEEVMRHDFQIDMVPEDDASLYLCRFKNNQKNFKLIGGQKRLILEMADFCSKLSTSNHKNAPDTHNSEEPIDITYKVELRLNEKSDLFYTIGAYMIDVYNDAKRTTLSANSWPSRQISQQIAKRFVKNDPQPSDLCFQYITPQNHEEFLDCIVKSDLHNVTRRLRESLAISLRLDGSTDSMQEHNIFTMAQVVNKDATLSTLFLGFGTPKKGDGEHYLQCIKNVPTAIMKWEELFLLLSSLVTDGESLNSGAISGLGARLERERFESVLCFLPFLWIWCIAHRINLAFKSTSKLNLIASTITLCKSLSKHFHGSGNRTLKLKQIARSNDLSFPLRYPKYFEVRWSEYVYSLFNVALRNWRACVSYFQSEKLTCLLKPWLSYSRLHFLTFMTDILFIFKNFQKSCQSDSLSILDLLTLTDTLFEKLEHCKENCAEDGWEQHFLSKISGDGQKTLFYGFELTRETPRTRRRTFSFTDKDRKFIITHFTKHLRIRIGLDNALYKALKPLVKIVSTSLERDLEACASYIIPDMDTDQFNSEYYEAADILTNFYDDRKTPIETLKKLNELNPEKFFSLKIALARVAAIKPHSADVERLISDSNKFKDWDRGSMSASTLYNYLYAYMNMGPVDTFDPTPAINLWMSRKNRVPKSSPKAKEQSWYRGVFSEASIEKKIQRKQKIVF